MYCTAKGKVETTSNKDDVGEFDNVTGSFIAEVDIIDGLSARTQGE